MKNLCFLVFLIFKLFPIYGQDALPPNNPNNIQPDYRFTVHTTWLSFANFGKPETNTHHYEVRLGYQVTAKDQIGIKFATWKLFAPLGIDIWDAKFLDREYFFPGRLKETGIGITYQHKFWKGLFATIEVMPLITKYLDETDEELAKGFKLYNSYHLGYHIPLFKKGRFYIEPQFHVNHWPVNNNVPEEFKALENSSDNFFFIEPNLYIGFKF